MLREWAPEKHQDFAHSFPILYPVICQWPFYSMPGLIYVRQKEYNQACGPHYVLSYPTPLWIWCGQAIKNFRKPESQVGSLSLAKEGLSASGKDGFMILTENPGNAYHSHGQLHCAVANILDPSHSLADGWELSLGVLWPLCFKGRTLLWICTKPPTTQKKKTMPRT